jgi:hypothetical protein
MGRKFRLSANLPIQHLEFLFNAREIEYLKFIS